jgi:hypothetical protein
MVKVTINGETYSFDNERYPLNEAIALEEALGLPFGEWQRALPLGSAKALAGFVWLVLRRNERPVPLADIVSGKFALNDDDVTIEADGADPTPAPSGTGGPSTSAPSPTPTGSARGKSTGSPSPSSTP